MKKISLIIGLILFTTLITGCKKEESIITGRVTYKGAVTGIEYVASNVPVYLHLGSSTAEPYKTVFTDNDGYYQFNSLWKAHWYISSETTVNGFNYSGAKGTTSVDGKNIITLDLIMF